MPKASTTLTVILVALAVLVAPPHTNAAGSAAVLGDDGSIYRVLSGRYGDLFPDGDEAGADHAVLALEITHADGRHQLLLVPETESATAEVAPTLVLDKLTGTTYLLWEGLLNQVHAVLHLANHTADDGWGPVLEITGNPYTRKAEPQLVVTRDTWTRFEPPLPPEVFERVVLHVSWSEESAAGSRKWYSPIVIENGRHLSWMPSWNLSDFLFAVDDPAFAELNSVLRIQPGWNDQTVIVGFQSTEGDRLATVEVEVLPGELASLADWARWQIENIQIDLDDPAEFGLEVETAILVYGEGIGFHQASLAFIAHQARASIEASTLPLTTEGRAQIADAGRRQIIETGVKMGAAGMLDEGTYEILEIERPDDPESRHLLKASLQSVRPTPDGVGSQSRLFLSERGEYVIIAWEVDDAVAYFESDGEGWTALRTLSLNDDLDAEAAFSMLERRARGD